MGLLQTVSHEASQMIAKILPSDIQFWQRVFDFYLRCLTYGEDVEASGPLLSFCLGVLALLTFSDVSFDAYIIMPCFLLPLSRALRLVPFGTLIPR